MGSSSFHIANLAPSYFMSLVTMIWRSWRERERLSRLRREKAAAATYTGAKEKTLHQ
jgi:hypothetical protein